MCNYRCAGKMSSVSAGEKMSSIFVPLYNSTCSHVPPKSQ
jgi:hypothetical protein